MNYFTPADLKQHDATYNYTARSGIGFAISASNEQVFISARDVERLKLDVGDTLRVWATDNYASPHTEHYPSRWRAVRVEVTGRVTDTVSPMPNDDLSVLLDAWGSDDKPAPVASAVPSTDFDKAFKQLMDKNRPWTVKQMVAAMTAMGTAVSYDGDLAKKVSNHTQRQHAAGNIAGLKVYSAGTQEKCSAAYFAKNLAVFYDYLDTPMDEE